MSTCVFSEEEGEEEDEGNYKNDNRTELNWPSNIVEWFGKAESTDFQKQWDSRERKAVYRLPSTEISFVLHRNGESISVT